MAYGEPKANRLFCVALKKLKDEDQKRLIRLIVIGYRHPGPMPLLILCRFLIFFSFAPLCGIGHPQSSSFPTNAELLVLFHRNLIYYSSFPLTSSVVFWSSSFWFSFGLAVASFLTQLHCDYFNNPLGWDSPLWMKAGRGEIQESLMRA